ncbi:DNA-processing protein DprA [Bacillaceae bacterium S4-13-58]
MYSFHENLIHLHAARGSTRKLIWSVLRIDPRLEHFRKWTTKDWEFQFHVPQQRSSSLIADLRNEHLLQSLLFPNRYQIVTFFDKTYPPLLRMVPDPPIVLYARGNLSFATQMPSLSVVGTRNPSEQAWVVMNRILEPLCEQNWVIVSGLARGIDSFAHKIALNHKSPTIAVLAFGVNECYPKENSALLTRISKNGLLLSEYPPFQKPQPWQFPERNRLISGLGFGTLVIEAKEKSGSLITVDQALEQGREVYAVPGPIFSEESKGCHLLIQQGAKLVQNTYDLVEDWESRKVEWRRILENKEVVFP